MNAKPQIRLVTFGYWAVIEVTLIRYPVLSLSAECRYDELCKALGGDGYFVRDVPEIQRALSKVLSLFLFSLLSLVARVSFLFLLSFSVSGIRKERRSKRDQRNHLY